MSSDVGTHVPKSVNYSDQKPMAVRAFSRRVICLPNSTTAFKENSYINIPIDTSVPGANIDPLSSYLKFDLTIVNPNPYIDYVNFGTNGAHALIKEFRVQCQSIPIEEIIGYNTVTQLFYDLNGHTKQPYHMFRSCRIKQDVEDSYQINAIKPPMVSQTGDPMFFKAVFAPTYNSSSFWGAANVSNAPNEYKPFFLSSQCSGFSIHKFVFQTNLDYNLNNTVIGTAANFAGNTTSAGEINTAYTNSNSFAEKQVITGTSETSAVSYQGYPSNPTAYYAKKNPSYDYIINLANIGSATNYKAVAVPSLGATTYTGLFRRPLPIDLPSLLMGRQGQFSNGVPQGYGSFWSSPSGTLSNTTLAAINPNTQDCNQTNCFDENYFPISLTYDTTDGQAITYPGQTPAATLFGSNVYWFQNADYHPNNPLNWPFIMPTDRYLKGTDELNTPQTNLQDYFMFLSNVKSIPVGIKGSDRASNSYPTYYTGSDTAYKSSLNFQNCTSYSGSSQSFTMTICLPLFSGIFGSMASKNYPVMLNAPGSLYLYLKLCTNAEFCQVTMDPCRRVLGTVRDYLPFGGSIGGVYGQFNYLNPFGTSAADNTVSTKTASALLASNITNTRYFGCSSPYSSSNSSGVSLTTNSSIAQTPWTSNYFFGIASGVVNASNFANTANQVNDCALLTTARGIGVQGCFACAGPNLASLQAYISNSGTTSFSTTGNGNFMSLPVDLIFSPLGPAAMQGKWTTIQELYNSYNQPGVVSTLGPASASTLNTPSQTDSQSNVQSANNHVIIFSWDHHGNSSGNGDPVLFYLVRESNTYTSPAGTGVVTGYDLVSPTYGYTDGVAAPVPFYGETLPLGVAVNRILLPMTYREIAACPMSAFIQGTVGQTITNKSQGTDYGYGTMPASDGTTTAQMVYQIGTDAGNGPSTAANLQQYPTVAAGGSQYPTGENLLVNTAVTVPNNPSYSIGINCGWNTFGRVSTISQQSAGTINMQTLLNLTTGAGDNPFGTNTVNSSTILANGLPIPTFGNAQFDISGIVDTGPAPQYCGDMPQIFYAWQRNWVSGTNGGQQAFNNQPIGGNFRGAHYSVLKSSANRPQTCNPVTNKTINGSQTAPILAANTGYYDPSTTTTYSMNGNAIQQTPLGLQETIIAAHPAGIPLPQYFLTRTPWANKTLFVTLPSDGTINNIPCTRVYGDIVTYTNLASETEACYGTYLPRSVPQTWRCFSNSDGYTGNSYQVSFQLSNVQYCATQIILPEPVTNTIIQMAVAKDISIYTNTVRTYNMTLQSATTQNILVPVKVASCNSLFFVLQPTNFWQTNEGQLYDSNSRFCPFTQITSKDTYPIASAVAAPVVKSQYAYDNLSGQSAYAVGQKSPFNIVSCPAGQGNFSAQLIIGNEFVPPQPVTSITEMIAELRKSMHQMYDVGSQGLNTNLGLHTNLGFASSSSYTSTNVTSYGDSTTSTVFYYDPLEDYSYTTAFTSARFLDDQTYIQNPNWNYIAACAYNQQASYTGTNPLTASSAGSTTNLNYGSTKSFHGIKDLFGARGPFVLPRFTPTTCNFVLGFDLDAWSNQNDLSRSGRYLGNNNVQLQLTNAVGLDFNNGTTGINSITCLACALIDQRISFQSGGSTVAYY